ncbi:MAG: ArsA family ATPase [Pseudanabaenaceae cyanobacterium]
MSLIVTCLGKGGVGKTTCGIAIARGFAQQGKKVLLIATQPETGLLFNQDLGEQITSIEPNFSAIWLKSTLLLENYWERMKQVESQFLRGSFFKEVYGQELGVLPGMDQALALSFLREQDSAGNYDVLIFDGAGDLTTLRMLGMPEILGWYLRRFRQVITSSAIGQALAPFVEPVLSSILQVDAGDVAQQAGAMANVLTRGQEAVNDPSRVVGYLVTTADPLAIHTAKYLWGSAQQIGLTIAAVLARGDIHLAEFAPLPIVPVGENPALLNVPAGEAVPRAVSFDIPAGKVRLFLPSFTKKEIKLIQLGPEITIEAGDQRRNLFLPPELAGKQAKGAKFQDGYLIISLQ